MNTLIYKKLIGLAAAIAAATTLHAHSDALKPAFIDTLVKPYLEIQEKLAGDNLDEARKAASSFVEAMQEAPDGAPAEEIEGLTKPAGKIADAADFESARKAFNRLSIQLISLIDHNGTTGETPLYMAYCPMAFGNKGASWLQDDKTIANPYYGARMLKCGSIKKQLAGE